MASNIGKVINMLLQPKDSLRQPKTLTLVSDRKPSKLGDIDWYFNVHTFYSEHFDNKSFTGFDSYIQGTVFTWTHVALGLLKNLIIEASKDIRFVESGLTVMLSCSTGERCSIAFTELLAKEMFEQTTINVRTYHMMEQRWFKF